ncbi:MAG: hypothetical protein Q8T08_05315 [Ignavibacteria bacterium]|nr:hypothetical protein [Ignavibacteria bacterium]
MKNIFKTQTVNDGAKYIDRATSLEKTKVKEMEDKIAKVVRTEQVLNESQKDYTDTSKTVEALKKLDEIKYEYEKELFQIRQAYDTGNTLRYIACRLDDAEKYNTCKSVVDKMSVSLQTFADSLSEFERKMKEVGLFLNPMQIASIRQHLGVLAMDYNAVVLSFRYTDKQLLDEFDRLMVMQEKISFVSDQQKLDNILKTVKEL